MARFVAESSAGTMSGMLWSCHTVLSCGSSEMMCNDDVALTALGPSPLSRAASPLCMVDQAENDGIAVLLGAPGFSLAAPLLSSRLPSP